MFNRVEAVRKFLFISIAAAFLLSCTIVLTEEQVQEEKNIDVIILSEDLSTLGTDWVYSTPREIEVPDMLNVEKIVFAVSVRSQTAADKCVVELYDFDREKKIFGSTVESIYRYMIHTVSSEDISREFPEWAWNAGFRFKSTRDNHYAGVTTARLLIYYK